MEHLFLLEGKFYSPYNPPPRYVEDYTEVELVTEPDQCYSIQEIFQFSMTNQLGRVNVYDQYDDSEEGAEYEFGTDQFEYRQILLDAKRKSKFSSDSAPSDPAPSDPAPSDLAPSDPAPSDE